MKRRYFSLTLSLASFVLAATFATALLQAQATHQPAPPEPQQSNLAQPASGNADDMANAPPFQGQIIVQPPESARVFGVHPFNQTLNKHGFALLDISQDVTFTYNMLSPPVPLAQQTYNGQRPTFSSSHYPALTWDMRQLGLHDAQFVVQAAIQRNSWYPGGPEATGFGQISLYKAFFKKRVEVKTGYIDNDGEFVGLFVGGLASNGSLGVYAVLPFEAGMSFLPKTAPAFNATFHTPDHTYSKLGFQRSFDPQGGVNEEARNKLGTRFDPKGDGLVMIYEGGYKQDPDPNKMQTWARVGYIYNDSHYASAIPGRRVLLPSGMAGYATQYTGNNQVAYVLADRQLKKTDVASPGRGIFAGFSYEYAPPAQNAYTQYDELRVYENGPFNSRPHDFVSLVGSHTAYSKYVTRADVAQGKSIWNSATSVTTSYTTNIFRGGFLATGLSYTEGPAITPRSHNSLALVGQLTTFF